MVNENPGWFRALGDSASACPALLLAPGNALGSGIKTYLHGTNKYHPCRKIG